MRLIALIPLLVALATPGATPAADWFAAAGSRLGLSPGQDEEFLDPEVAFVVTAEATAPDRLLTTWRVEEGYYLYTQKFGFTPKTPGMTVGAIAAPATEIKDDPYFGRVPTVTGDFIIDVPLTGGQGGSEVTVEVAYQGCAEAGICYPPMRKLLTVALPQPDERGAGPSRPAVAPGPLGAADAIAARLGGESFGITLATFFGFGLLLALTPCVLPMIPILSGLIIGAGDSMNARRGVLLSGTYVLAMAGTYALAGVVAGLFGRNLQAAAQHPAILIGFAAIFVVLAAAMFGLVHVQVPAALQGRLTAAANRQRTGSLGGVAAMGVLSAIIVGPCVAPPLAGALLYIAASGDAVLGGFALFALALGMGVPLLAIGASAGHWLPRAGVWMESVKHLFGYVLLGVALWLLERLLPAPVILGLAGVLLLAASAHFRAFDSLQDIDTVWRRVGKGIGLAVAVWGAALVLGAAAGGNDPLRPLAPLTGDAGTGGEPALQFARVQGADELAAALAAARTASRPVMLDLYADWCIECKQLERTTFADPGVRAALAGFLLLQADVTANDAADQRLLKNYGLFGPPAILFFGADGAEQREFRVVGYVAAREFRAHVAAVSAARVASR